MLKTLFTLWVCPSLSPLMSSVSVTDGVEPSQIGFLTEWQMYAQKIEGDSRLGERLDGGKIDKMSGMGLLLSGLLLRKG